jgi:hypothetical protein
VGPGVQGRCVQTLYVFVAVLQLYVDLIFGVMRVLCHPSVTPHNPRRDAAQPKHRKCRQILIAEQHS